MIPPPHIAPTRQQVRRYACHRAPGPATIDGNLGKGFWAAAPWTDPFVDIEGDEKPSPPASHRTRVKMLWDDECLYVGACLDEPHVWGVLTAHDSIVYHDNDFEVFLNPTGDNHNYYEVEINALGTVFDLFLPRPYRDGGPADHGWDVVGLRKAILVDGTLNDPSDVDRFWSVELAIPWTALDRHGGRCGEGAGPGEMVRAGDRWRVNFSRVQWEHEVQDGRYHKVPGQRERNWVWSPQGLVDMHRPEMWGHVLFVGSSDPDGASDPLCPDESEEVRSVLHQVYYAQAAFRYRHGRWAESLAELDLVCVLNRPGSEATILSVTRDGWLCEIAVHGPDGNSRRWAIRHDSLISRSQ